MNVGDRVVHGDDHGVIAKHVPAQGSFREVFVVDFDDGSRRTVHAHELEPE